MPKSALVILLLLWFQLSVGQHFYFKITSDSPTEQKIIDSIAYQKTATSIKEIHQENNSFNTKIQKLGYLNSKNDFTIKTNDSVIHSKYNLGKKTKWIHIYIGDKKKLLNSIFPNQDSLFIKFDAIEYFCTDLLKKLENNDYPLSSLKLIPIKFTENKLIANIDLETEQKRTINKIIFEGVQKFPPTFEKNINRIFRNKSIHKETLEKIFKEIEKIEFVKQSKFPEILFTKDSTKVYVFIEKFKANSFDGFIGFTNDEAQKIKITGYLDLNLKNILNSGEKFSLNWKNDGNKQTTFNLNFELPYLFKSPIGIKTELNIFKQDSTFQNSKTALNLGYYFNHNSKVFLGYQTTESSDIQNINNTYLTDYKNKFTTISYEFKSHQPNDFLFPTKTQIQFKIGIGNRTGKTFSDEQYIISAELFHNFYLNEKNIIQLKTIHHWLESNHFLTNELFRFGGINNFRGFNENSLQGNLFSSLITEYKYRITNSLFINSILDYGYYQDRTNHLEDKLFSVGIGTGLLTKNGLLKLIYANGSTSKQEKKLSNSVFHISLSVNF